jgi:hypothetical protein
MLVKVFEVLWLLVCSVLHKLSLIQRLRHCYIPATTEVLLLTTCPVDKGTLARMRNCLI